MLNDRYLLLSCGRFCTYLGRPRTTLPIPILKADGENLKRLWLQAREREDVFVVDFTDVAQASRV